MESAPPPKLNLPALPVKLLAVGALLLLLSLIFGFCLDAYLSHLSFSKGVYLSIPGLLAVFLFTASLLIVFSLVAPRKALVPVVVVAALLFAAPLSTLTLLLRGITWVIFSLGVVAVSLQVQAIHELYTKFSAHYFQQAVRNLFLAFVVVVSFILFSMTSQALGDREIEIPQSVVEQIVGQLITAVGGAMEKQVGVEMPEEELAPRVEEMMLQLLGRVGFELELEGKPKSLNEVTGRLSRAIKIEIENLTNPFKIYIPLLVVVFALLTLFTISPLVSLAGGFIFFLTYRLLIIAGVLKLESVERTVTRLGLA
jgi:hypothetical protein